MRYLLLGGAFALFACSGNGQLIFSPVVQYAETDGFQSPIAVGRVVLVSLEDKSTREPLGALTLSVDPQDTGGSARVFPVGLATFGVVLETAGDYQLTALDGDQEAGSILVTAEDEASVRTAKSAEVITTNNAGTDSQCSSTDELHPFNPAAFVLHANQTLQLAAVPLDAQGTPLLGLLPLTAAGPNTLELSGVTLNQGAQANAVVVGEVNPGTLGEAATLTFTDETLAQSFTISLQTSNELEDAHCK
jgi:hypothetical protein